MTTIINKEFLIRYQFTGQKNALIAAGQYPKLVGPELAEKHFNAALSSKLDKYTVRLRRGLTINFIAK